MEIHEAVAPFVERARIASEDVERLCAQLEVGREEFLRRLVGVAAEFARPPISDFRVGAVAEGSSGAVYLGANVEMLGGNLALSIHAEQSAIINAGAHGETGVRHLAISAEPCGYCRQFLKELTTADELVILAGPGRQSLSELLPNAFGPGNLGITERLLSRQDHSEEFAPDTAAYGGARKIALEAARRSYAPYSHAYGGAALTMRSGEVFPGSYLENAAFNPSLQPAQCALALALLAGARLEDIVSIEVVQCPDSKVDHLAFARLLAAAISSSIEVAGTEIERRPEG